MRVNSSACICALPGDKNGNTDVIEDARRILKLREGVALSYQLPEYCNVVVAFIVALLQNIQDALTFHTDSHLWTNVSVLFVKSIFKMTLHLHF